MTFKEYQKITSSGFDLPEGIAFPKDNCSCCGAYNYGIGLSSISCLKCGRVSIMWFVPLER